jgi:hypothetical protein
MYAVDNFFDEVSGRTIDELEDMRDKCFLRFLRWRVPNGDLHQIACNVIAVLEKNMIQAEMLLLLIFLHRKT